MPPVGFGTTISAGERPQTYAVDRAATETGQGQHYFLNLFAQLIRIVLIHSLVFSLEGRAWQEPEPSHVTGMALAHRILGKFLGVV